ncbi:MAG: hypothetical protein EA383_12070 [Spirochaetaceae bacterium]|nr:MAG: hypothetical protein EA383_12070 [Spirochaetaceae bacterium]
MIHRLFVAAIILSASTAFSQSPAVDLNHLNEDDLHRIQRTLPNDEASQGERELFEFISERIQRESSGRSSVDNVKLERVEHSSAVSGHSFSDSLLVSIAGRSDQTLLILVPVNSPSYVQDLPFGAPGIIAALELILAHTEQVPEVTLHVVFGTAARRDRPLLQNTILERFDDSPPDAIVLVDILTPDRTIEIVSGSPGVVAPPWLIELVRQSTAGSGFTSRTLGTAEQIFRIGARPSGRDYLIEPFLNQDIPSVLLVDGSTARETWQNDTPVRLTQFETFTTTDIHTSAHGIFTLLVALVRDLPELTRSEWDRNAIRYTLGGREIVIGETEYLIFLLVSIGFVFAYAVTHRQALARYIRTIRRNILSLPLLFGISYVFLLVFGQISEMILTFRGTPELSRVLPVALFGFKIFGAFLLLQVTYLTVRKLPLSRNGSFYSAASVLMLLISVFVFGSLGIATAAPFVMALLATVLFTLTRNRMAKIVFLVLAVIPPAILTFSFLSLEEGATVARLVSDPVTNLLPTLVVMPYLMLLVRMDFLFRHPVSGGRSFTMKMISTIVAAALVISAIQLASAAPFSYERLQRVRVIEESDLATGETTLVIESISEVLGLDIIHDGETKHRPPRSTRTQYEVSMPDPHLELRVDEESFLARRIVNVTITSDLDLVSLEVALLSDEPLLIYQSTFPFRVSSAGNRVEFVSGRNPPNELELQIVIPVESDPLIEIRSTASLIGRLRYEHDAAIHVSQSARQTVRLPLLGGHSNSR